jgi:hypothetical protein
MDDEFERIQDILERQINFDNLNIKFKHDKKGSLKMSIRGLSLRNPILKSTLQSSIISNVSNQIPKQKIEKLYAAWKESQGDDRKKDKFEEGFQEVIIETISNSLKDKLALDDIPTPIFPTSVAISEIPNYYISEPKEIYNLTTKFELFIKLVNSKCGKCGQRIYGVYVPEEWIEVRKGILKNTKYFPDFYNANIPALAGVGRINIGEIGPFEYLFYLLDRILQEMYRRNAIPNYHLELIVQEKKTPQGKPFFYHYIVPNLSEIFKKLYYGDDKYTPYSSKIKALVSSFLVENWNIDNNLKRNNSEMAHNLLNRFLYYLFAHKKLDMDSILTLEDMKIKLGDNKPILFLEEVTSWM